MNLEFSAILFLQILLFPWILWDWRLMGPWSRLAGLREISPQSEMWIEGVVLGEAKLPSFLILVMLIFYFFSKWTWFIFF